MANEIETILDGLDDIAEAYVWARVENHSTSMQATLKAIGVSKAKFYETYDAEQREKLDKIARQIRRDTAMRAQRLMSDHVHDAAQTLIRLMQKAKSEYVQYQSAMGVLSYVLGTPRQQVDVTSNGETVKMYSVVSPDDWDE